MPRPVLFVLGQAAAAAFLAPLFGRWLARGGGRPWRVAIHPSVERGAGRPGFDGLPLLDWCGDEGRPLADVLGDWRPELVVTSASYKPMEGKAIDFARRNGVATAQFIDTWYDYAQRLSRTNGHGVLPDRILVIDDRAAAEAEAEGLPGDRLLPVGNPAWESVSVLPPADARTVMFVSQPVDRYLGDSLGYTQHTAWALVREAARRCPDRMARLLWAPHPEEGGPAEPGGAGVTVVESARAGLERAGVVLGLYSSVMVDAVLAGRRVISVQPNAGAQDKCSLSRHGLISRVRTVDELLAALARPPSPADALRRRLANSCDRLEAFLLGTTPCRDSSA